MQQFQSPRRTIRFLIVAVAINALSAVLAQDSEKSKDVIATISGHQETVYAVAMSGDGKQLLTGSFDKTVKLWDLATRQEIRTFGGPTGHQALVLGVTFAPDGQTFASCSSDSTVKIWDVPVGKPLRDLAMTDAVTATAMSADGKNAAAGGKDGSIQIWNTADPKESFRLIGHVGAVTGLAYAANGQMLASSGIDGTLRFWNPANGQVIAVVGAHATPIHAVALSPNGNAAYTAADDGTVKIWQLPPVASKPLAGHQDTVQALAMSNDGATAATGCADKNVRFFNTDNGQIQKTLNASAAVSAVGFAGTGANATTAAGTSDGKLIVWGNDGKPLFQTQAHEGAVTGLAIHPNGTQLLTTGADGKVTVWALPILPKKTLTPPANVPTNSLPGQTAMASNGNQILTGHQDGSLKLWSAPIPAKDAKPIWNAKAPTAIRKVIFDPKAGILTIGNDGNVRLWDAKTGKETKAIPAHDGEILDIAISADGTKLVSSGADKSVKVWTVADGKSVASVTSQTPAVRVAISPNGNRLAIARSSGKGIRIFVHDTASRKSLLTLEEPYTDVASLAFAADNRVLNISADKTNFQIDVPVLNVFATHTGGVCNVVYHSNGTQAFTGGKDKTVKLWDIATGKEVKAFGTLVDSVNAVAISRDSVHLAAAAGKTVKIWNVADGKELASLPHPAEVISVAFSADRSRLVTGTTDNLARVWDLAPIAQGKPAVVMQSFAHGAAVLAVSIHPGKPNVVVTASADKTAAVHTMTIQRTIVASTMPVRAMALSPSGQIITVGDDMIAKAITPGNEAAARSFGGATAGLLAVAVSKNGSLLATAGSEKIVRIYNMNDANLLGSFPVSNVVRSLSFHPSNLVLLSAGDDKTVTAWNIVVQPGNPPPPEFGKPVQTFAHSATVLSAGYSNDGTSLISGGEDRSAHIWKVAAEGPTKSFQHANFVDAIAYNKDGTQLASGSHDGTLRIWDIVKGTQLRTITAHPPTPPQNLPAPVYAVAWSPDNKQIASGSLDKSIKIWDAVSGTLMREIKGYDEKTAPNGHRDGVFTLAYSADGQWIISGSSDRTIKTWKAADGTFVREFINPNIPVSLGQAAVSHPGWVYQLRYAPDGKSVVSVGGAPRNKGYVGVWNPADGKLLGFAELPVGPIYGVAISPDGATLALACGPRGRMNSQSDAILIKTPGK